MDHLIAKKYIMILEQVYCSIYTVLIQLLYTFIFTLIYSKTLPIRDIGLWPEMSDLLQNLSIIFSIHQILFLAPIISCISQTSQHICKTEKFLPEVSIFPFTIHDSEIITVWIQAVHLSVIRIVTATSLIYNQAQCGDGNQSVGQQSHFQVCY